VEHGFGRAVKIVAASLVSVPHLSGVVVGLHHVGTLYLHLTHG
jgi:hypothetical protein